MAKKQHIVRRNVGTKSIPAFISTIEEHATAVRSLKSLAVRGCDLAALYELLSIYLAGDAFDAFAADRLKMRRFKTVFDDVMRRLSSIESRLKKSKERPDNTTAMAEVLEESIARILREFRGPMEEQISRFASAKGFFRKELFLVLAIEHTQRQTGEKRYEELSDFLTCYRQALGESGIDSPERIKKIFQRYTRTHGVESLHHAFSEGFFSVPEKISVRSQLLSVAFKRG